MGVVAVGSTADSDGCVCNGDGDGSGINPTNPENCRSKNCSWLIVN